MNADGRGSLPRRLGAFFIRVHPRSSAALFFLAAVAAASILGVTSPAHAQPSVSKFTRGLDAYFSGQPYRAIVLVRESMTAPDAGALRAPSLYVLGQAFAQIHLYEKSEDSFNALLLEFPNGPFAPQAMREMARIFFGLREHGAVVNLQETHRGRIPEGSLPAEYWYLLGQSHYMLERHAEARGPLLKVAPGSPFHPFAMYTLAQVEFTQDQPEAALQRLSSVAASPQAPSLLRERAHRMRGMILYQQRRFHDSIAAYQAIGQGSPLFGVTRVDIALSAEAAGDSEIARQAFRAAMDGATDDLIRTEAKVAVGRFLNRQQKGPAARTLFQQAVQELAARDAKLRENVENDTRFRETFRELVAFGRQGGGSPRRQRLAEDYELLRSNLLGSLGVAYERPPPSTPETIKPKTYLFPLLQRHYHNPAAIETFVSLAIEIEDLNDQLKLLGEDLRGQTGIWNRTPPIAESEVPEAVELSLQQTVWLLFAHFDLVSRFYDALAVTEKVDKQTSLREKQSALATTTGGLRLVLFGQRVLPSAESLLGMMEVARRKIESGEIPGMRAEKVQRGFLQEWRTDRDSLTYVLEHLSLKERQMASALSGVPLRSRNLNLPVLSTMTDWLTALQQLVHKYHHIELERGERPWVLAGRNGEVVSLLKGIEGDLTTLNERGVQVVRELARELVAREQYRHSLVTAQAEEGIADALYQERSAR